MKPPKAPTYDGTGNPCCKDGYIFLESDDGDELIARCECSRADRIPSWIPTKEQTENYIRNVNRRRATARAEERQQKLEA